MDQVIGIEPTESNILSGGKPGKNQHCCDALVLVQCIMSSFLHSNFYTLHLDGGIWNYEIQLLASSMLFFDEIPIKW